MEYPDDLHLRLRHARRLAEASQDELGERIGRSQQSVQRYEKGGLPASGRQLDTLVKQWAEATGTTIADLLAADPREWTPNSDSEPEWVGELRDKVEFILGVIRKVHPEAAAEVATELLEADAAPGPPAAKAAPRRTRRAG